MIPRKFILDKLIKKGKVLVIYGPRRVGKTTLLNDFLSHTKLKFKLDSGDNIHTQQILNSLLLLIQKIIWNLYYQNNS